MSQKNHSLAGRLSALRVWVKSENAEKSEPRCTWVEEHQTSELTCRPADRRYQGQGRGSRPIARCSKKRQPKLWPKCESTAIAERQLRSPCGGDGRHRDEFSRYSLVGGFVGEPPVPDQLNLQRHGGAAVNTAARRRTATMKRITHSVCPVRCRTVTSCQTNNPFTGPSCTPLDGEGRREAGKPGCASNVLVSASR